MIDFSHVTKSYPNGDIVVDDLSLSITTGDFVVITGKSGAGKTTIGRLLIRDLLPTKGTITVDGEDLTKLKPKNIPMLRRKVGVVFQDFKIIPDKTVGENISIALEIAGFDSKKIKAKVDRLLDMVGIPGKANLFPIQLAGGEIQRAAIARAIACEPPILFADEPTGNLDKDTSIEIFKLLQKINSDGTTIIMATHDVTLIDLNKARHIHIEKGKIISDSDQKSKQGKSESVLDNQKTKPQDPEPKKDHKNTQKEK